MFEPPELISTSRACFDLPSGDGHGAHCLAREDDVGHSRAPEAGIRLFDSERLNAFLAVWSLCLLGWALPSQGWAHSIDAPPPPAARVARAMEAGLQGCDYDARDDSEKPTVNFSKRLRKRRARLEDEDASQSPGRLLAALPDPVATFWTQALGPPDSWFAIAGPARSARSMFLRC
jgi:hypothetical protein